mgnify:CR=1 FL=1
MAIKVGGTTVVDDTRQLTNISSIDATTVSALNSAGIVSDIVADITPQLGGNLDLNSNNITGTGDVNITGSVTATSFSGDGSSLTGVGGTTDFQEFTSSGTWTKPSGVTFVLVEMCGGGGGGGNETTAGSAAGGAGGEGYQVLFSASALGSTETVTIAAGGAGTPDGSTATASTGGDSTFGSLLTARGGRGGNDYTNANVNSRAQTSSVIEGSGGGNAVRAIAHFSAGPSAYNGGYSTVFGGGGGGGSDNTAASSPGVSEVHGDGGAASIASGVKASNGEYPGGGGGGSGNDGGGGDGADGRVRVWSW